MGSVGLGDSGPDYVLSDYRLALLHAEPVRLYTYFRPRSNVHASSLFYRCPSVDFAERWCNEHSHIWFEAMGGDARNAKVNGAVRRWKRDRNRIEIPVKYGMYEFSVFTASDIHRILIPASELRI